MTTPPSGETIARVAAWAYCAILIVHVLHAMAGHYRRRRGGVPRLILGSLVALCSPFVVLCLGVTPNPAQKPKRWVIAIQTALFLLAAWWAIEYGVFSRQLISPVYVGLGLVAGHLVFFASLLATQGSWRDAASHFAEFGALWDYIVENPSVLTQYLFVSVAEELTYRVAAQPLFIQWLHSPLLGILVVAVLFSFVHEHFFTNSRGQSTEFMVFAILLGALYYWSGSLILVIAIHAVRNIEIAFIEHRIHQEEAGDARAVKEEEFLEGDRILVMLVAPGRGAQVACLEHSDEGWAPFEKPADAATA